MKVATVIGARPQFVKAAMVSRALKSVPGTREVVIHTGQHYDFNMSEIFFDQLEMDPPDFNLKIRAETHGAQTGQMLCAIEGVLLEEKPDCVLVYGDTNSTLAGALAAVKLHHCLAHVEAGLRSFNRRMPEEINRVLTDHAADLLFAPTENAAQNLHREGVPEEKVFLTGDVMYDAVLHYGDVAEKKSKVLERLGLRRKEYILATVHRAENTDSEERMESIVGALANAAKEIRVVLPLHPRTRRKISGSPELSRLCDLLLITDPLGYIDMMMLEKSAALIATDSGGVQKEAFFHRVPCVTLRDETEWLELIDLGWNRLAPPTSAESIAREIRCQLEQAPAQSGFSYGNGQSAEQIVSALSWRFGVDIPQTQQALGRSAGR